MKKYLILSLLLLPGCVMAKNAALETISNKYDTVVFEDQINLEEAKIIAQKQVIKENVVEIYKILFPKVSQDIETFANYEKYWFIFFEEKRPSNIPFIYMVVIDKETGKVKFANDFDEDNKWILEAELLR